MYAEVALVRVRPHIAKYSTTCQLLPAKFLHLHSHLQSCSSSFCDSVAFCRAPKMASDFLKTSCASRLYSPNLTCINGCRACAVSSKSFYGTAMHGCCFEAPILLAAFSERTHVGLRTTVRCVCACVPSTVACLFFAARTRLQGRSQMGFGSI